MSSKTKTKDQTKSENKNIWSDPDLQTWHLRRWQVAFSRLATLKPVWGGVADHRQTRLRCDSLPVCSRTRSDTQLALILVKSKSCLLNGGRDTIQLYDLLRRSSGLLRYFIRRPGLGSVWLRKTERVLFFPRCVLGLWSKAHLKSVLHTTTADVEVTHL